MYSRAFVDNCDELLTLRGVTQRQLNFAKATFPR